MPLRPLLLLGVPLAVLLAACSSSTSARPGGGGSGSASPSASGSKTGCVGSAEAKQVWSQIDTKLNAIELDPHHAGVSDVATGQAQTLINQYLQQQLEQNNVTEREVDKLLDLTILDAGCNGGSLRVRATEMVVQDDYLKPNGQVDHADPAVGTTLHIEETFVRSGSSWKESDFQDLDQPSGSATPQLF